MVFYLYIESNSLSEKEIACKKVGIALVVIPYWWDQLYDSFLATIFKVRPDLVPEPPLDAEPIPELPLTKKFSDNEQADELIVQE